MQKARREDSKIQHFIKRAKFLVHPEISDRQLAPKCLPLQWLQTRTVKNSVKKCKTRTITLTLALSRVAVRTFLKEIVSRKVSCWISTSIMTPKMTSKFLRKTRPQTEKVRAVVASRAWTSIWGEIRCTLSCIRMRLWVVSRWSQPRNCTQRALEMESRVLPDKLSNLKDRKRGTTPFTTMDRPR